MPRPKPPANLPTGPNVVAFDGKRLVEPEWFHTEFAEKLGFPAFYGRNMNAWNDCMSCLDDPEAGLSTVHVPKGTTLTIFISDVAYFRKRAPQLYADLIECSAFVNWRRINAGDGPVVSLAFWP